MQWLRLFGLKIIANRLTTETGRDGWQPFPVPNRLVSQLPSERLHLVVDLPPFINRQRPNSLMMDHRTKEEQVADLLREYIISGVYPRGSRLKQAEIAQELEISITPVREALKMLEAEGYICSDSYKGAQVVPFDAEASGEILQLRILLEVRLVQAAVEKVTSRDILELRTLAKEFQTAFESGDRAAARGVNYRFHRRLYDLAELPHTLHFVQILWARYPFDLINAAGGRGEVAVLEHEEILNTLTARDSSAAMLAMRKHIESGWEVLKSESTD